MHPRAGRKLRSSRSRGTRPRFRARTTRGSMSQLFVCRGRCWSCSGLVSGRGTSRTGCCCGVGRSCFRMGESVWEGRRKKTGKLRRWFTNIHWTRSHFSAAHCPLCPASHLSCIWATLFTSCDSITIRVSRRVSISCSCVPGVLLGPGYTGGSCCRTSLIIRLHRSSYYCS